jgi:polysaccharide pyruvyl transferase WcaK-like protein
MSALRVIGWFGRRNSGDEAFRVVHTLLLPDVELAWLVHGAGYPAGVELDDSVVLISAGDIVLPFYFDLIPEGARIIVYGVGLAWADQIETLRALRDRIIAVWVRNEADVAPIRALGIAAHYTPDIAMLLHRMLGPPKPRSPNARKGAIVTISDSPRADTLRRNDLARFLEFQAFCSRFAMAMDYVAQYYDIEFIPFSFDRNDFDLAAIYDIVPRMQARDDVTVVESELAPLEAIDRMRGASLVVSMKFHGVIYAIMNKIPFIAVSDTRKVGALCRELGLPELLLPPTTFQPDAFKQALTFAEQPKTLARITELSDKLTAIAETEAERFRAVVSDALKKEA